MMEMDNNDLVETHAPVPMLHTLGTPPSPPIDDDDLQNSKTQPKRQKRKRSIVWEHFTIETVGEGCTRAICKHCNKSFAYITGAKLAGTSHLKRHVVSGSCVTNKQMNPQTPVPVAGNGTAPPKRQNRASAPYARTRFNQEHCNQEIAKMIILHDYPLHMVEHPGFLNFVRSLQPKSNAVSFNTIQSECVAMYLSEKQRLSDFIRKIPGRINLTLDLWTSSQTVGYAFLTGHFIDNEWNLHRRVLNVLLVPSPDLVNTFAHPIAACLSGWGLDRKLLSLTANIDQSVANKTAVENLRCFLSVENPHIFNGQLLIGSCYANVISQIAQDALRALTQIIKKIRDSVKYVKTSDSCEDKFYKLKQQLRVPSTKDIFIDDQSKWNTTYLMLVAACEVKEVFSCLESCDANYTVAPSLDEWEQVEILCKYLRLLFDAANIITYPAYPTANLFYHEVSNIQSELTHATMSLNPFVSSLAKPLKIKFDKYWNDCFLVLAVAAVMDPRFKMKLIQFSFTKLYGEDAGTWIKIIDDGIQELFLEYVLRAFRSGAFDQHENVDFPLETFGEDLSNGVHPEESWRQEVYYPGVAHEEDKPQKGQQHPPEELSQDSHHHTLEGMDHECHQHTIEGLDQEGHQILGLDQEGHQILGLDQEGHPLVEMTQEGHSAEKIAQKKHPRTLGLDHKSQQILEGPAQNGRSLEEVAQGHSMEKFSQEGHSMEKFAQEGHSMEKFAQEGHCHILEGMDHISLQILEERAQNGHPIKEVTQKGQSTEKLAQEVHHHTIEEMDHDSHQVVGLAQNGHSLEEMTQEGDFTEELAQEGQYPIEELPQVGQYPLELDQEGYNPQGSGQNVYHSEVVAQEGNHQEVSTSHELPLMGAGEGLSEFELYICEMTSHPQASELDQYLEESLMPRSEDFDVLDWWKQNAFRYPVLSKMASDILSIPFSTVVPDSVYDTTSKKMDSYHTSLNPATLEALLCAKDWFQHGEIPNARVNMEV